MSLGGILSSTINMAASVVIGYSVAKSLTMLAKGAPISTARITVARGVVHALGLLVAVALLNTLRIFDWEALGLFAVVLGLRTVVKAVFTWDERQLSRPQ